MRSPRQNSLALSEEPRHARSIDPSSRASADRVRPYIVLHATGRPGAAAGLPGGVSDLPPNDLSQQLLAGGAVAPARAPGSTSVSISGRPAARRPGTRSGGARWPSSGPGTRGSSARRTARSRCTPTSPPRSPRWPSRWTTGAGRRSWSPASTFPRSPISGSRAPATEWRSSSSRARTASRCRSRPSPGRWTTAPRWSPPATCSSPAAPSRMCARWPTLRTGAGRCCWWTGIMRQASSRWTCGRWTWTSIAAAASSGCSAGPAWRSCTRGRSCGRTLVPRASGWFAHREQFRFDPAVARAARRRPPARGGHAGAHAGLRPARRPRDARGAGRRRDPPAAPWRWPRT